MDGQVCLKVKQTKRIQIKTFEVRELNRLIKIGVFTKGFIQDEKHLVRDL